VPSHTSASRHRRLGEYGIRVNTIAPGYISTEMLEDKQRERAQRMGTDLDGERRRVEQTIPLRRHGSSHDVADAVAYLTSDQASYVTGWTLGVAGGVVLH
jgi:3-oxoacyl-[acyl-carrier protein] reductase